jgi:hypothetical protein
MTLRAWVVHMRGGAVYAVPAHVVDLHTLNIKVNRSIVPANIAPRTMLYSADTQRSRDYARHRI